MTNFYTTRLAVLLFFGWLTSCQNTKETHLTENDNIKVDVFFDSVFLANLEQSPESLTFRGDKRLKDEWDDYSQEKFYQEFKDKKTALRESHRFEQMKLSSDRALSLSLFQEEIKLSLEGERYHNYQYPFNQMYGAQSHVPSFLIGFHSITTKKDAEDYISRVKKTPDYIQQQLDLSNTAREHGYTLPKYLYAKVLSDCQNLISGNPLTKSTKNHPLKEDFVTKVQTLELPDAERQLLIDQFDHAMVYYFGPTYKKLIHELEKQQKGANQDAGVWKVKDGDEFYAYCLKNITSTALTAEEIHLIGLSEVERIHQEMKSIKTEVGFEGTLQDFFKFMKTSPQFYYDNTNEGKEKYLAEATSIIDAMRNRLDELFITKPKAPIQVKRVEEFREKTAGKAFYNEPAKDGSRPGYYYANLYDTKQMPIYEMEALAFHEGIPGHHMQLALTQELSSLPEFRKAGNYTAYIEGWGLYSEWIPKEMGFYKDPYSNFGRLAMELWRACRLVVDTGIHAKRWTREEAIEYYTTNTPSAYGQCEKMVDRHIVMPGQATAYKVGMMKIQELRDKAQLEMGDAFDIRQFHEVVLGNGPLPLSTLEKLVNQYIGTSHAR
ncbi:DUF885 domain-containing protein [Flammeovirga agarivorans]|uniref:DUF885 domain-containing protein n=1 Tax=Flammeovirga agarivorans TaxID=2726742 RepID=A0A7X8XUJ0_9BACT|nr:DUF885 domain-containing protein [Flammeovirga agarivorans]NLR90170.1 DUF885 domain-containing protein [Flammeovirga agarivorans]